MYEKYYVDYIFNQIVNVMVGPSFIRVRLVVVFGEDSSLVFRACMEIPRLVMFETKENTRLISTLPCISSVGPYPNGYCKSSILRGGYLS